MIYKKLGVYTFLLLMFSMTFVSAAITDEPQFIWMKSMQSWLGTWLSTAGSEANWGSIIIGIITCIILLAVFIDILTLATPFSDTTNWIIAVGLGIIAIMFGFVRSLAGWLFSWAAGLFAIGATFGVVMSVVVGVLIIWVLFFGGQKLSVWLAKIKARKVSLSEYRKGVTGGAKIKGLRTMAEEAMDANP